MHGDDEFGHVESTLALPVGQSPDSAQNLIGKACALENGLGGFACGAFGQIRMSKEGLFVRRGRVLPASWPF